MHRVVEDETRQRSEMIERAAARLSFCDSLVTRAGDGRSTRDAYLLF